MKIAFLFYHGMTALDAVGPHEILCRLPGVTTFCIAQEKGLISTDSGLFLSADYSLSDLTEADILFLPGAGNATTLAHNLETLDWIRTIHSTSTWTTSVCTGSLILGRAGLLKGVKSTTHWAAHDRLKLFGAIPIEARIVEDGKFMTAAGVSAGIDMALLLAAKISGQKIAETLQLGIEYDPAPPFDVGSPLKAHPDILKILQTRFSTVFEKV